MNIRNRLDLREIEAMEKEIEALGDDLGLLIGRLREKLISVESAAMTVISEETPGVQDELCL
ncbi:MAG: hypothetical protein LBQ96_02635 [Fusobacteriaceae bacterium]|jgi:hypothetical protein|nr:hypothetical protein [Fusobacteriaceae bacterium]